MPQSEPSVGERGAADIAIEKNKNGPFRNCLPIEVVFFSP
jgi:hypothetical protein